MKKILFVSTIHRMSERMLPAIIDYNTRHGEVTILNLGQSSANTLYKENIRYLTCLKNVANDEYGEYINDSDTFYCSHHKFKV